MSIRTCSRVGTCPSLSVRHHQAHFSLCPLPFLWHKHTSVRASLYGTAQGCVSYNLRSRTSPSKITIPCPGIPALPQWNQSHDYLLDMPVLFTVTEESKTTSELVHETNCSHSPITVFVWSSKCVQAVALAMMDYTVQISIT